MLKITLHRPDTHPDHALLYEWDTEIKEDERIHTPVGVVLPTGEAFIRNEADKALFETKLNGVTFAVDHPSATAHFNRINAEHERKNNAEAAIHEVLPEEYKKPHLDSDGEPTGLLVLKDKHRASWRHDGNGEYTFHVPGLASEDFAELQRHLKTNHKVELSPVPLTN